MAKASATLLKSPVCHHVRRNQMATWHYVNAAVTADPTILQYPTESNLFTALSKKLCFDHYLVKSINPATVCSKNQKKYSVLRTYF